MIFVVQYHSIPDFLRIFFTGGSMEFFIDFFLRRFLLLVFFSSVLAGLEKRCKLHILPFLFDAWACVFYFILFLFCLFGHVFILCFFSFSDALGGVCAHGLGFLFTFTFCLFTLPTTVSYIRTFVYPGWVAFFSGFLSKKVHPAKFCIFY